MSYEKLSDETKILIHSYLDYESMIELSKTNRNNNQLYKSIENKKYIPIISQKTYYIYRKYQETKYNYFFTQLFVKVIYYNQDIVSYQYVSYGRDKDIFWPMKNYFLYWITFDITHPGYEGYITVSRNEFEESYRLYNFYWRDHKKYICILVAKALFIYTFIYLPVLSILIFLHILYYVLFPISIFLYTLLITIILYTLVGTLGSQGLFYQPSIY